jgi:hypothetical protein
MFKKYFYLMLSSLLFFSATSNAQINQFEWGMPAGNSQFYGQWYGLFNHLATDTAGNVFITSPYDGDTLNIGDTSLLTPDFITFTAKIDKSGHTEWVRFFNPTVPAAPGLGPLKPKDIITDIKGDCYIIGMVFGSGVFHGTPFTGTSGDVFAAKIRQNGDLDWITNLGGITGTPFGEHLLNRATIHNGSLRIGGGRGKFYTKIDTADGSIQHQTTILQPIEANRIETDNQGNNYFLDTDASSVSSFAMGGVQYISIGPHSSILLKQDSMGNSLWIKGFSSSSSHQFISDIKVDRNGDIYVAGAVNDSLQLNGNTFIRNTPLNIAHSIYSSFVSKFDSNMNLIWTQRIGGLNTSANLYDFSFIDLELDLVGNIYIATSCSNGFWVGNHFVSIPSNGPTSIVAKFNSKGSIIWMKQVDGYYNSPRGLAVSQQGIYLYGNSSNYVNGIANFNNQPLGLTSFITKLANQGTNLVSGLVFIDDNENGVRDNNEETTNIPLIQYGSNYYQSIDTVGNFSNYLLSGTYTIGTVLTKYWKQTKPDTTIIFANAFESVDDLNFGVKPIGNVQDLEVYVTSTAIRPGFDMSYSVIYRNVGTIPMSGSLELIIDDTLTYLSSTPMGIYTEPTITWNYSNLKVGETRIAVVRCNMPVALDLLGTDLVANAVIQPVTTDTTPTNNVFNYAQEITGSYDPNDKQVTPSGAVDTNFINDGRFLYHIRFQNTGNDTAFTVRVADTLNNHLDISTLQMIGASHDYVFDLENKAILWTFNNILLPDNTTNEPESHGFITYSIRPKETTQLDDTIANTAHIYFDFNPPIITNTTISAVEILTQTHQVTVQQLEKINVFPNPTDGWLTCEVDNFQSNETYFFKLFDMQGRLMAQYPMTSDRQTIDLPELPFGMYIYQLISAESGLKGTGKILMR